ncbi:MAG: hypothetical protein ACXVCY_07995 [Pseudobdellovibrionaceae bacterium]
MKQIILAGLLLGLGAQSYAAKPTTGAHYAVVTKMDLDAKLPEPFARTKAAQVALDFDEKDATLTFIMSEQEGVEITFPITSDSTDACNNRTVIATPPADSTPYYKDFEIKITDYSENTCDSVKAAATTVATLKSYEVGYKSTTLSTLLAGKLQPVKKENPNR